MYGFEQIVEKKIQEAIQNGEFDNLPGKGKPLNLEDMAGVPDDLRLGFKVLKNAGFLPEEMQLKKEISSLEELIATAGLEPEKLDTAKAKLFDKIMKYKIITEKKHR